MLKLYTLTICYNEDTDEIEYIEECVDNPGNNILDIGFITTFFKHSYIGFGLVDIRKRVYLYTIDKFIIF